MCQKPNAKNIYKKEDMLEEKLGQKFLSIVGTVNVATQFSLSGFFELVYFAS
jgi:hypothetical protein